MTIYHSVVLLIILVPLIVWIYRASARLDRAYEQRPADDISGGQFALRMGAVSLGFFGLFALVSENLTEGLARALVGLLFGLTLYLLLAGGISMLGRAVTAPKRRLVEMVIFVFALALVAELIVIRGDRVAAGEIPERIEFDPRGAVPVD